MSNSLPALVLASTILFTGAALQAQTVKSLEICGVPFKLGMTHREVRQKLVLPPGVVDDDDFMHQMFGGDIVNLNYLFFGLPETSKCYGTLFFRQDRVAEVQETLTSTNEAVPLLRSLFLELRKLTESRGQNTTVKAWGADVEGLSEQFIRFTFGEEAIQLEVQEGKVLDHKIDPVTTIYAVLSRP